ncbi:MAG: MarR family winged helix-turn-helix transcriptional regulator, partial [Hyphomicrobiaceae bacterium]
MLNSDLSIFDGSKNIPLSEIVGKKFMTKSGSGHNDDLPLEDFLTYRLVTLTNRLNRQAKQLLDESASLRLPEWRCLAFIKHCSDAHGKAGLHQLAEKTEMDRALISRSVQGLVEKGHV